jgi:general stress protein YciG
MSLEIPEFDPDPPRDWGYAYSPEQPCYSCDFTFEEHKTRKTLDGGRSYMCPDGSGHRFRADHRVKEQRFPNVAKALEETRQSVEKMLEPRRGRGFALLEPDQVRDCARKGMRAVEALGLVHRWTPETARRAAKKAAEMRAKKNTGGENMSDESEKEATETEPKIKRGFAAMPPERVRELARRGGISAHVSGRAYRWTSETARVAGSKGGHALHNKRRAEGC